MALGRLDIIMAADMAQLRKDMSSAVGIMQSSTNSMKDIAKTAAGAMAGYFSFDLFRTQIQETLQFADSLSKLSQKSGITADALYSLNAAARLSDVDFSSLESSLAKFSKAIGETSIGTGDAKKAFDTLGVSVKNQDGTLKNSFDLLGELADKFEVMPDGVSKATLAIQLFGKSGSSMIPMLNGGSEALKEYSGIMSNDVAKSAERFNDSLTKVGLALNGSVYTALGNYTSSLDSLSKTFEDFSKNGTFLEANAKSLAGAYDIASSSFNTTKIILQSANGVFETSSNLLHGIAESITSIGISGEEASPKLNFFQFLAVDVQVLGLAVKVISNTVNAAINDFMNLGNRVDIVIAQAKDFIGAGSKENDVKIAQLESWIAQRNMQNAHMALEEAELAVQIENYKKRSSYENEQNLKYTKKYLDEAKANLYDLKLLSGEVTLGKKVDFGLTNSEEYEKALIKINDAINKNSLNAYDYGVSLIEKEVAEYQKAGISKSKIDEYVFNAKIELGIKQLEQETKDRETREKEVKAQYEKEQDAMLGYYKAVGMESDAFYLEEIMKLQKLADAGILSNSQMLEIWAKDNEKFQDEQFKKTHEWLYDLFDNVNKALDESFFNTMTGKFTSFGDWLKSFFKNIGTSIAQGLSRSFAGSITNSLQGGIVNSLKSYGGFGGGASLVGSTLSASDLSSLVSSGATASGGKITTSGGTVIDQASGMVTSQGSDAMSILGTASSLKTAYGVLSSGISSSILSGFQSASGLLANLGFGGASSGLMSFGAGVANPFAYAGMSGLPTSMLAGSMASSGLLGGLGGYALGSLGDKIFGANTYAGTTGAIGGALGGIGGALGLWGGPIGIIAGSLLGSVLGGLFGKTKVTGSGIDILGDASSESANGQYYTSYKKKSWFSSKSWKTINGFSDAENQAIMQTIGIYDTLLSQLGEYNDLVVSGGRFSSLQSFLDTNVVKAFLGSINPKNLDTIYQSWVDYATEIDSTITEALASAVSGFTTYKRGYTEWFLGSGTVEQLEFTASYLQKDFEALASSLGASSVTVDNFLSMYDTAIKENFTQDTIEAWASLGDALMKSTDAAKDYQDALDELNATTTVTYNDMLLSKASDQTNVYKEIKNSSAQTEALLTKVLKVLEKTLTLQQLQVTA